MIVAAIVQARTGSTRLPGKVLRVLPYSRHGRRPQAILAHVIARARAVPGLTEVDGRPLVCVATTKRKEDDAVARLAQGAGARVFRGDEHDVLARFAGAAASLKADVVLRLTADCPLLDPAVAGEVLAALLAAWRGEGNAYASNVCPPTYYDGCDAEAFPAATLRMAAERAEKDEREHVTPWLRRSVPPSASPNVALPPGFDFSATKLSVDTAADYLRVVKTYACLRDREVFGWRDVLRAHRRAYPGDAARRAAAIFGRNPGAESRRHAYLAGAAAARDGARRDVPHLNRGPSRTAWLMGYEDVAEHGRPAPEKELVLP